MEQRYNNIRYVIDKILRHPLMQDLNFETAVDYTVDFLRLVGAPTMFEDKLAEIEITDYRGILPCDFYEMIQVRDKKTQIAYIYTTDSFHGSSNNKEDKDLTYKIQGNIIFTSTKNCTLELSYKALAVDEEGYPLLPDNSSFTRALTAYIKKEWFQILFDLGKINGNSLQLAQRDYAWAVGDCESEFKRLSIDKMQAFTNSLNTLVQRTNEHKTGFRYNNARELLKRH